jgi:anaerobic selenocysteine-containing dehydrogenase
LPNCNREGWFDTLNSKANFNIATPIVMDLEEDDLMMMTIRSHDQFNTTIYGLNDRYRGIYNERRVILMNQADMNKT